MSPILLRIAQACAVTACVVSTGFSQPGSIHGMIVNEKGMPFGEAHIRTVDPDDSLRTFTGESAEDGTFHIDRIPPGTYRLEVSAVGYRKAEKAITVSAGVLETGTIVLAEQLIVLDEVVVQARVPPAIQKGDTTEYIARAFKTNRDATAEDLLTKMPGITVDNGTVRAGGENIQRVLVDGKPFFGDDPALALRNLPAEVVDKIQLFDQMSDQAQFTGFDDGQSVRALNITTRRERSDLKFGVLTTGYGDDHRYEAGGNFNSFQGDQRISLVGLSNNVNVQNFTTQDLLGVMSGSSQVRAAGLGPVRIRGGGGRGQRQASAGSGAANPFAAGQQQGINTTHLLGGNVSDSLGSNLFAQGSYFVNRTDNQNQQNLNRTYLLGGDSTSAYKQNTDASTRNFNHRINGRVTYAADEMNSVILVPQLYIQSNRADNAIIASTAQAAAMSGSRSTTSTQNSGYDLGGHAILRHKFDLPGRTISFDLGVDNARKATNALLASLTEASAGGSSRNDTADQSSNYLSTGRTVTASLVYTEPMTVNSLFEVSYAPSFTNNDATKSTFDFDPLTGAYSTPDLSLTNAYANTYLTQKAGAGYRLRTTAMNLSAGLAFQRADLRGDQGGIPGAQIGRSFETILPNALLTFSLPDRKYLRIMYWASTLPPTVAQLQNVVDNSNPLLLTTGNPSLDQSFSHSLMVRYSETLPDRARSMFAYLLATMTNHYIGNATVIPGKDTTLADGTSLLSGTQLSSPVNLNGYWNVRSFFTYGFPFDLISSTLNLNAGVTFTRTPGLVNALQNISNAWSLSEGFVVGSNISQDFDFTVSYLGNYTLGRNTIQSQANSSYYSHTAAIKWTWTFWEGVVLRNDLSNVLTAGQAAGYNQNSLLWNISVAKKLFKDRSGEMKVGVADLLGQNKAVSHSVTDSYLEDTRNEALTRYVMVNFTYTLR